MSAVGTASLLVGLAGLLAGASTTLTETGAPLDGAGSLAAGAIGPTGFAIVVWGAIALVLVVFAFVVWALLTDR